MFVSLSYDALNSTLLPLANALSSKFVVDVSNPENADWSPKLLGENSAGEETQRLQPRSKVVKAFNTAFADVMGPDRLAMRTHDPEGFDAKAEQGAAARRHYEASSVGLKLLRLRFDWFNSRRLLEPIGNIPPAKAEERYYAMLEEPAVAA